MSNMRGHKLNQKICTLYDRGADVAAGCSSVWAEAMGGECCCGNLLWQSYRTLILGERAA